MKIFLTLLFLLVSLSTFAETRTQVERQLARHLRWAEADVSFIWKGESYNRGKILVPASLAKLFTVQMAFEQWGSDQRFQTRVSWQESSKDHSVISGLQLSADGDPEFNVDRLVDLLIENGVRVVEGPIRIVGSLSRQKPLDRAQVDDSGYCYNALSNHLNMNTNCVSVRVNSRGATILDPDLKAKVRTRMKVGGKWSGTRPHFSWTNDEKTEFSYTITGQLQDSSKVLHVDVLVPDTEAWIVAKIQRVGKERGLSFKSSVSATSSMARGFNMSSLLVGDIACEALRDSRNVYADALFRKINEEQRAHFLGNYPDVSLVEGSGLSRANSVPAYEVYNLLESIMDQGLLEDYLACLPSSGETGTLENRMRGLPGLIRAKTGSLSGMSHLAGFAQNSSGQWEPFVLMYQKRKTRVRDLRKSQDALLKSLLNL